LNIQLLFVGALETGVLTTVQGRKSLSLTHSSNLY